MALLKNLSIRYKMLILVALPLTIAITFIVLEILKSYATYTAMNRANEFSKVSVSASLLVHELQKERGTSAGYLSSGGEEFSHQLQAQKKITNTHLLNFEHTLDTFPRQHYPERIRTILDESKGMIKRLKNIREQVKTLSVLSDDIINYYTHLNHLLLSLSSELASLVDDPDILKRSAAYYYFLESKERAGAERAVLNSVFAEDSFTNRTRTNFVALVTSQKLYLQVFDDYASEHEKQILTSTLSGYSIDEVERYRNIAYANERDFGVEVSDWFNAASDRINLLKEIEATLATTLIEYINQKQSDALDQFTLLIGLAVISVLLTILISVYLLKQISRQLISLSEAMLRVSEHSDLTVRSLQFSEDEMGVLAKNFNNMVTHLKDLTGRIDDASVHLLKTSDHMTSIAVNVNQEVQSGLEQTDTIAAAMHEMEASVQEVAENCSSAADQAQITLNSAQQGQTRVHDANKVMQQLTTDIDDAMSVIHQVADDSNEIGSILDVIKSIAEQTNLLALNAAIEAARAGDQGRGFAVVADEVRGLAHKTQESTGKIEMMIEQLQNRSSRAVQVMKQSHSRTGDTTDSFGDVLSHLMGINDQASRVNDMNLQNATATEEQSSTVDEISINIQNIQQRYKQTNNNVSDLSDTANTLTQLATNLSKEVSRFKL